MRVPRIVFVLSVVVWLGFAGTPPLASQQPGSPNTGPTKQVKLDLIVEDKAGQAIHDIKPDDLEITYDGVVQKISYFEKVQKPVLYALLVDTSMSFRQLLPTALGSARLLIEKNTSNDETVLVRFAASDQIESMTPFASDKAALIQALEKFQLFRGQSAVLDAIYVSVEGVAKHKMDESKFRRAIVLISDGEDRASFYEFSQIASFMQEKDVQVFIIGMTSQLENQDFMRPGARGRAEALLKKVAEQSGGRVFFPKTPDDLIQAVDQISYDLRSQYVVGFEPIAKSGARGFQKLKVRMARTSARAKLKPITRPGFWVTPPEPRKKN
jgi:Ca-activated chloride channel family protein